MIFVSIALIIFSSFMILFIGAILAIYTAAMIMERGNKG